MASYDIYHLQLIYMAYPWQTPLENHITPSVFQFITEGIYRPPWQAFPSSVSKVFVRVLPWAFPSPSLCSMQKVKAVSQSACGSVWTCLGWCACRSAGQGWAEEDMDLWWREREDEEDVSTALAEAVEARDPGVFRLMVVRTYSSGTIHAHTPSHTQSWPYTCWGRKEDFIRRHNYPTMGR